ncbi:MAG: FG-GAP-like repeat-containing protein, partial [bacterium]
YVITAVNTQGLEGQVADLNGDSMADSVFAYPNPPLKSATYPRNLDGTYFKGSPVIAQMSDPSGAAGPMEIAIPSYGGTVATLNANGTNFAPPDNSIWPIPLGEQFRSSIAVGRIMDTSCDNLQGTFGADCLQATGRLWDNTVEYQLVIGGTSQVYMLHHYGQRWGTSSDQMNAAVGFFRAAAGMVSGTPALFDVVNAPDVPPNSPGTPLATPDGWEEVFAANEGGQVKAWTFRRVTNCGGSCTGEAPGTPMSAVVSNYVTPACIIANAVPNCLYNDFIGAIEPPPLLGFANLTVNAAVRASPAVGDIGRPVLPLGADGFADLVVATAEGTNSGCLFAWDASGRAGFSGVALAGFPTCPAAGAGFRSSPAIGNLQTTTAADPKQIVVGADNGIVYAFTNVGGVLWQFQTGSPVESSPALADMDGDDILDVIVGSDNGRVYVLKGTNGMPIAGWDAIPSASVPAGLQTGGPVRSSPAIADVNGDGSVDVVVGSFDGKLYAFHRDGRNHPIANNLPAETDFDSNNPLAVTNPLTGQPYCNTTNPATGTAQNPLLDCAFVKGFPFVIAGAPPIPTSPALGHIEGAADTTLELIFGADDFRIYGFEMIGARQDGTAVT